MFTAAAAPASAETPGVGSTVGSLSVVDLDVGDLLALDVLQDFAGANTDTDVSEAAAAAALDALTVAAPALGVEDSIGLLDVRSTGDEDTASSGDVPVSNPVLGGALLPAALSALLDADGAVAGITAGVADLDVLGGIAGLDNTQLGMDASALTQQADGSRRLVIDNLAILELGDLLAGLGIPLDALSPDTLLGLVGTLGLLDQLAPLLDALDLPVDLLDLESLTVEGLTDVVDGLLAVDDGAVCVELPLPIGNPLCDVLDGLPVDTDLLLDLLTPVLDTVLGLLDGTALLELQALDVGMVTKATDSLDSSLADVTATLGGISVLGLPLPEVDVLAAVEQVTSAVDGLLAQIDPALGGLDLIDLGILEETSGVSEAGEAIVSEATFTGLRLDVTGLTDEALGGVLAGLPLPIDSVGGILGGDSLLAPVTELLGDTGGLSALSDGLSLKVASLGQTSTFTEVLSNTATPATPAAPDLPRTGSNDALMMVFAAIAAGGALGIRRMVRTED
ncbi:hypothetical protein [Actinospongicola halichondriae]|uniref:hypothetical protein n=1 Tax=Actinospongicola halichondriae TaxID=3236844 RepID=UPI003D495FAF